MFLMRSYASYAGTARRATASKTDRRRLRDSDSESGGERSFLERPSTRAVVARANVGPRRRKLVARNRAGMIPVWRRHARPHFLSDESRGAEHHVVAAVVANHPGKGRYVLVVTAAGSGRVGVTPCSTQEPGVRPNRQRQHERKDSCSKHVKLDRADGKKQASEKEDVRV
jgi:hypothetical protein